MPEDSYLIHLQDFHCLGCGNSWTHSSLFHVTNTGAAVRLDATSVLDKTHERLGISTLQPRNIPVCSSCVHDFATTRNEYVEQERRRWQETIDRKREEEELAKETARELRRAAKPPVPEPSLDQL